MVIMTRQITILSEKRIDANCDITWAMAAPLTPKWSLKMNIGSKMMFATSPTTALYETDHILCIILQQLKEVVALTVTMNYYFLCVLVYLLFILSVWVVNDYGFNPLSDKRKKQKEENERKKLRLLVAYKGVFVSLNPRKTPCMAKERRTAGAPSDLKVKYWIAGFNIGEFCRYQPKKKGQISNF